MQYEEHAHENDLIISLHISMSEPNCTVLIYMISLIKSYLRFGEEL